MHNSLRVRCLASCLLLAPFVTTAAAVAQTSIKDAVADTGTPSTSATADTAWQILQTAKADSQKSTATEAKDQKSAKLVALANQARSYYTSFGSDERAGEARKLEIFTLIQMSQEGDSSQEARLDQAADELRAAKNLPVAVRAQGAAAHDFTKEIRAAKTLSERKTATEKVARSLIKEFPGEPQGYQALWALASSGDEKSAPSLAKDLVDSDAPADLKAVAQTLLDREALVGKPLADVVGEKNKAPFADLLKGGRPFVIYSWATRGPGSMALGALLATRGVPSVAVNLDEDRPRAEKKQAEVQLAGVQIYGENEQVTKFKDLLKFFASGQALLIDAKGVISDVRLSDALEKKLTAAGF